MPNQSHSGWQGRPWHRCDRCGVEYHADELTRQLGLILCKGCWDDPLVWERDAIMAEVLQADPPDLDIVDILKESIDDNDWFR